MPPEGNYIFFGGQRLARNVGGDIKYYITDHLHSTGMFVDKAGTSAAILNDNDFYSWGGVVPGVGFTTSNNTVKFTGKYRDSESQLDYFGARYYSNTIGRWMSPDWAAKPATVPYAKFGDPQSLNLYSYVENGPINRVDADGHSYAGFDGFMRPEGNGEVPDFMESGDRTGNEQQGGINRLKAFLATKYPSCCINGRCGANHNSQPRRIGLILHLLINGKHLNYAQAYRLERASETQIYELSRKVNDDWYSWTHVIQFLSGAAARGNAAKWKFQHYKQINGEVLE